MRRFSSYGPVDKDINYYAPRKELVEKAYVQLMGEYPEHTGHYITVWAPRQAGKSWTMREILWRLQEDQKFDVLKINLEHLKRAKNTAAVIKSIGREILKKLAKKHITTDTQEKFQSIFEKDFLTKPLILILDEFDALSKEAIATIVETFRNIYNVIKDQKERVSVKKDYLLHGVALIGVRSVLGVENKQGSPFNVQRSLHIPNFTYQEVETMYRWYEKESGRKIDKQVIDSIYYEFRGQPGLTCWFGELLSQGWEILEDPPTGPVTMNSFDDAYTAATCILPNANVLNIINKADEEGYRDVVLEFFRTQEKVRFNYDDPKLNYLYMNGVIDREEVYEEKKGALKKNYYVRFSSPFIQKRLFNYFAREIFRHIGKIFDPFEDMEEIEEAMTDTDLDIRGIMRLYSRYLLKNRNWLLKDVPRRSDLRIYEAVFHFNLYRYLYEFLPQRYASVIPEFPTGNGKIDIIIRYADKVYGLELKSYTNRKGYKDALDQASDYGKELGLKEISLIFFVEKIDDKNRERFESDYFDERGVKVMPVFVETGS
jgi:hypothetical protein